MRILIYTGKGGVGKTSIAAATGVKLAEKGIKTLVVSTDLAHSLSDSLGVDLNYQPTTILKNLDGMELNPQHQLENHWAQIYQYLVDLLKMMGIKDIFAEELTMFPGVEELFSLLEIHEQFKKKGYDVLIMDFPPTASAIRLLSFFDIIGWYMEKFFKIKKKSIKFLRTFSNSFMELPLPEEDVFTAVEEIYQKMEEVKGILTNPEITSVRLVLNPEEMVINESQRAYTYLSLYGFRVDCIIVNKLFLPEANSDFYNRILARQRSNLTRIEKIFSSQRVFTLPLICEELKGLDNLKPVSRLLYQQEDPLDSFFGGIPLAVEKEGDGYHYRVYLPFLQRDKFRLHQKGGILIVTIGDYKQKLHLPQLLSNKSIKKAQYRDSYLHLSF